MGNQGLYSVTLNANFVIVITLLYGARRLPTNPQLQRPARQAIGVHFAIVGRTGARIRLSLRINISLTNGETYKIVEDFLTQFSPLYLPNYIRCTTLLPPFSYRWL